MEGGDNIGGTDNDVGGGALSGSAADPSTPSNDPAAAADGGGVVDNSSPVVDDGSGLTAINTDGLLREWHTGHGEDCQDCSWQ